MMTLISEVCLADVATERLEAELKTFAAHVAAATCRWLLMVAEYDRRKGYESWECVSIEQWLSIHVGMSPTTARAHVAVARRLRELPAVTAAFSEGRLSYSKVRALCRVATGESESAWLSSAEHASASQLERITADTRRVWIAAQTTTAARQADERSLSYGWTDEGMLRVSAVLAPEVGVVLVRLLEMERDRLEDPSPVVAERNADAFAGLLERVAVPGDHDHGGDERPRPLVVVHRELDGSVRLEAGPPIPAGVADEIECDGETVVAWHCEAGIGFDRRRRHPAAALRRYLRRRDRSCRFPGCQRRHGLAQHHIREYGAERGETTKENMVLLCASHHGAIHRRGWTVSGSAENATLLFHTPDGEPVRAGGGRVSGDPEWLVAANHRAGVRATPDTIAAKSMGERYDHELAVWAFANSVAPMIYNTPPLPHDPAPARRRSAPAASAEADTTTPVASAEADTTTPTDCFVFDDDDNLIAVPHYEDDPDNPLDATPRRVERAGTHLV